jgi:hypothetical protein
MLRAGPSPSRSAWRGTSTWAVGWSWTHDIAGSARFPQRRPKRLRDRTCVDSRGARHRSMRTLSRSTGSTHIVPVPLILRTRRKRPTGGAATRGVRELDGIRSSPSRRSITRLVARSGSKQKCPGRWVIGRGTGGKIRGGKCNEAEAQRRGISWLATSDNRRPATERRAGIWAIACTGGVIDFGFWIADFGLETRARRCRSMQNPKSAIQNGYKRLPWGGCRGGRPMAEKMGRHTVDRTSLHGPDCTDPGQFERARLTGPAGCGIVNCGMAHG